MVLSAVVVAWFWNYYRIHKYILNVMYVAAWVEMDAMQLVLYQLANSERSVRIRERSVNNPFIFIMHFERSMKDPRTKLT